MVSCCANPECRARFLYLRAGKLFVWRRDDGCSSRTEFFWLCGECAHRPQAASFLPGGARLVSFLIEHPELETEGDALPAAHSSPPVPRELAIRALTTRV